ncbi:MAG: hypothetical protein JWM46_674 [Candidatus Kaiserbacteria bacterium]|nr:hypothetical protein [Candidatus Kaiserbacteria bacterium]
MTTHQGRYKRRYDLALVKKGPGAKQLLDAKPGDEFTFDGQKLVDGDYSLALPKTLVEAQNIGTNANFWVLWFSTSTYPHWVERMIYNSHERSGILECWELKVSDSATAQEKAEHEDAGSTMELPVSGLWVMCLGFAAFGLLGYYLASGGYGVASMLMLFWAGVPSFAIMAIYKQDRDRFNRALDVIRSLDLRREPATSN